MLPFSSSYLLSKRSFPPLVSSLLFHVSLLRLATSSHATASPFIHPHPDSLPTPPINTNLSSPLTNPASPFRHCVETNRQWNPFPSQSYHPLDECEKALEKFEDDIALYGERPGKFRYMQDQWSWADFPGADFEFELPAQYESGRCVITVVRLVLTLSQ